MGLNQYEIEKKAFEYSFKDLKKKRIAIYGIGRFTATLIPMLSGWNIVGLLDKDEKNIGKEMFGLPVLSNLDAQLKADAIIINTSASYWDVIYERICGLGIPVYYRNGELAEKAKWNKKLTYWNRNEDDIHNAIKSCDVISFDFFDTLFSRVVSSPRDVFEIIENKLSKKLNSYKFLEERIQVPRVINNKEITLFEIYEILQEKLGWEDIEREWAYELELDVQKKLLKPRMPMIDLIKNINNLKNKELYIISDMYLPKIFFLQILQEHGIDVPEENVWISAEKGYSKKDGEVWKLFQDEVIGTKRAVHIGDDKISDIEKYKGFTSGCAIDVMSPYSMLKNSCVGSVLRYEKNIFHSLIVGLVSNKLFCNPFVLNSTEGVVSLSRLEDVGYAVLGPVIFSFLMWLDIQLQQDGKRKILFAGRDGYFLQKDYEFYIEKKHGTGSSSYVNSSYYLETSRQLLISSCIETQEDAKEYISFPYVGTFVDYCRDRLFLELTEKDRKTYADWAINAVEDCEKIVNILEPYYEQIYNNLSVSKKNYIEYLKVFDTEDRCALVDLGYFGTTQLYLQRLMDSIIKGYYIVADISEDNTISRNHDMASCTEIEGDRSLRYSNIHAKGLALESFLTAPHGMARGMNENGFIYSEDRSNQKYFEDKERINNGILEFITDILEYKDCLVNCEIRIDKFIDEWWGEWISKVRFSEEVKRSFYNDNAFVHRNENLIFE